MRTNRLTLAALLISAAFLSACQQEEEKAQSQPAPPPSEVAVVTTKTEELPITNELPGRIAATRTAEVRPRVSGIVVARVFEQGTTVQQGDVLYRIDPAPFQVQVDSAEATLARAKAVQNQARITAERQEQLRRSNVATQQNFDDAVAQLAAADADVAIAEAGVASARLSLQYTNVTAPITGRIGRALITEGALVSQSGTENLATIQQLDPVYADFTQTATDVIRLRKALQDGQLMTDANEAAAQLLLDDGTPYPEKGRLLFSEAAVDETTGQITLRGEFANPNGDLLPGMYVRGLIQQGIERNAIAVPQQAIQRDTAGKALVYVVNGESKVEIRPVTTSRVVGDRWVVSNGLKPDEKIIVEGFQKIGPGAPVKAVDWNPEPPKPAGEAAPAAAAKPEGEPAGSGQGGNDPAGQPAADAKPAAPEGGAKPAEAAPAQAN
ncbi:efflux RND transporter periplasmic adaptor subunit [Rhizobium sp. NFR03]|uniref:efflux RND transporter periplasmic adaptor subunit n=1 Tax=Rhizobium sp. NFR03 TaxID=1566263 RepID=UPI0008D8186E|nr:efflux RND transporter periplasmic adaptor subunit [Rhizobium sp. NFR03]SER82093.1 membrane fusion protein, multidrug efflux system [Rhizobium sp. NFR03]